MATRVVDTLVGVWHFLFDRVPSSVPEVSPKPRKANPWLKDGKPIVVKINAGQDIRQTVDRALAMLGPLTSIISRGDRVVIKPNLNSADLPPARTDLGFLTAVIQILLDHGAKVTVGDGSGALWRPTANVFRKIGLYQLARSHGINLVTFEGRQVEWVRVAINGDYMRSLVMPRVAYEADRLIYLPCLKTHYLARYSGALKLPFGFVHPGQRRGFHVRFREGKLAEINLCWQPDLIIMDGRKAFVTGGPTSGQVVEPGIILASGDPVAIDVEAVKVLLTYNAKNHLLDDPWQMPQIKTAVKHGLGAARDEYVVTTERCAVQ